jgi:hypothetical protein
MDKGVELSFWIPTGPMEIIVIVLFIAVLTITFILFHYGEVQKRVARSRCALQSSSGLTGVYTLSAIDSNDNKLYHIDYNFDAKSFDIFCDCNPGQVVNNFDNVPVYNIRTQSASTINKLCNCDKPYDFLSNKVYYNGDNGIIRFMSSNDASFFTQSPI